MNIKNTRAFMRFSHRYLGYFLAGIMAIYAVSGILLVFRDTDFLKKENHYHKTVEKNLTEQQLGKALKIKNIEILKSENGIIYFKEGFYQPTTGAANYHKKELPYILSKITQLHKSSSKEKIAPLNVFFGCSLFFFVISSFWMFHAKSKIFWRGIAVAGAGLIMALLLVFL